jgi:geranyl diphosphate 2-C-methyltransferase
MTSIDAASRVLKTSYQRSVAEYWNQEKSPVNLRLGELDNLYHHHYGLGDVDASVLDGPASTRDERIIAEMHRLESAQATCLLDHFAPMPASGRMLDAGCGRGGTSFMAHQRFGCRVDGISISESQVVFSQNQARSREVGEQVRFELGNMLDTGFADATFDGLWNNESTMYVDLFQLFAEHARVLKPGGRYVCITGCHNDVYGLPSRAVSEINAHYICNIHPRSEYFRAMAQSRLVPISVVNLTAQTIPYWELRQQSSVATGIETSFLSAYRDGSFHYLLIVADRI